MCRRERYFDCFRWRHLFVEYRQYVCCCQRDSIGDYDLYGDVDEYEQLHGYCHHNDHSKSASIGISFCNGDFRCDE